MTAALKHAWDVRIAQGGAPKHWDHELKRYLTKVLPGEYEVGDAEATLSTLLGSCVCACIRDPVLSVGGMNHFMLPDDSREGSGGGNNGRYGAYAMEVLINEIMKMGGKKHRLEAKVFGGGAVLAGMTMAIGERNAQFVLAYLAAERIPVIAQDLGGTVGRKVVYFVDSGRALVRHVSMGASSADLAAERDYSRTLVSQPVAGDIELFD
ncbi:chemoreceptor glutamine deamidase CheD [Sinimarinibacterium sp. NLF-5-8]|uniref:chemoreceptor glutamine deamidase CheD n=1 Tax=Sinimarinibacterium sp. NLF-5-8 TaxID=2698684 RepID=UPI00137C1D92|nr:chemoreceptor glutamine deamidase CheD [Sinimarinibacterium sp. NLF-5-8]QHS08724.1 chemoreceptor glutamine deamidase CheD [Sinimarinibacterium sp. NLF-5-8]